MRDKGYDGVVISTAKFLNQLSWNKEVTELKLSAGSLCKNGRETAKK